jgi:hypothetical protein
MRHPQDRVALTLSDGSRLEDVQVPLPISHANRQLVGTLRRDLGHATLILGPRTNRRDIYVAASLCVPQGLTLLGTPDDYIRAMERKPGGNASIFACI